ncbi:MAG: c-type cytochrome [Bacteroidales bacterium]|nr:c-type cytochrome [Bacteroidales bacterium]
MRFAFGTFLVIGFATSGFAQPQHIAATEPLAPAAEAQTFQVPNGFEVQLVAAEPDIQKPIQMAFDAAGRLWVTTSHHYPFAAENDQASDRIYILSDFDSAGKARSITLFADTLNIPIGVLPLPDGKSCLASSVGEIVKLTDTNGDGKADQKETLLSGFGTRDTHGMYNSFRLLPDGWVYACHGFSNTSTVTAKDGSSIKMNSGNTFRFRPDGSRIEPWTFGQVNPFGMTLDPHGLLYTADCHSKPITQLIRGATYQSFFKPHDGLGFAPHVTAHSHGSTALCGLAWYDASQFPAAFQNCLFLGNVVTNRVNADRIRFHGSTPIAEELPDFLVSQDPWFRPTDIQLGPDGHLYIADFYNRIIGHYEVDLKHPGRDKKRGRVWRVVWKGAQAAPRTDLTRCEEAELLQALSNPNLTTRMLAAQQLRARFPVTAEKRFVPLSVVEARRKLTDPDPFTQRLAVEVLTGQPERANITPLVEFLVRCPAEDTHLKFAARVALRNSLQVAVTDREWAHDPNGQALEQRPEFRIDNGRTLADAALGIPNGQGIAILERCLTHGQTSGLDLRGIGYQIGRYGDRAIVERWWKTASSADPVALLTGLIQGTQARKEKLSPTLYLLCEEQAIAGRLPNSGEILPSIRPETVMGEQFPALAARAGDVSQTLKDRHAALVALTRIHPVRSHAISVELLQRSSTPPVLRNAAVLNLASSVNPAHLPIILTALATAPASIVAEAAPHLVSHRSGAEAFLQAVAQGKLSPRLLQEKIILDRLRAAQVPNLEARVAELTRGLPPAEQRIAQLIRTRADAFAKVRPDPQLGAAAFKKHCAACHQLRGEGQKIGPQLDGIGNRGRDRVLEDLLDPNRNVDAEFRTRILNLVDGRTVSGAFVRIDGAIWILADQKGQDIRIPQADIESWKHSPLSPMPANFGESIPEPEFFHLLAFLLDQRVQDRPKP